MKAIVEYASSESDVRHSRFLAEAFPVASQEEARERIKAQKEKYRDATHVVHAFVIGQTGGVLGCSDDGEPAGTAGRPVLDVLKGSGVTNALLTVTRWFGGTLLGTGGLVQAYGDAAKAVLAVARTAELALVRDFSVRVSYDAHDRLRRDLDSRGVTVTGEEFGVDVLIQGTVAEADAAALRERVTQLTSARSSVTLSPESRMAPIA
jgi:uncharacterized YigZ family protein